MATGAAVAAAVAAGLIVFFVTRGDGDSEQASAGGTTAVTTQAATTEAAPETETTPATTAAETTETAASETEVTSETEISALIPNEVFKHCEVANTPRGGAMETAVCGPSEGNGNSAFPDRLEISTYPDAESLAAEFSKIQSDHNIETDTGRCTGVRWGGEGGWNHGPDRPGGHRLCYFDGDDAVLVWTHEKLGQADHRDVLAIAREGGIDHARLFGWWRFWVHRIGRLGA